MHTDEIRSWYAAWMTENGYKPSTIVNRRQVLKVLLDYLADCGIETLDTLDLALMEGFARYVKTRPSIRSGLVCKPSSVRSVWQAVTGVLKALYETGKISVLPLPKRIMGHRDAGLMTLLSAEEVSRFLDRIDSASDHGRRDRALFELIYSSGLRASEVTRLKIADLNLSGRLARIRQSKFDKDRVVPLTGEAVEALLCWLTHPDNTEAYVFPSQAGGLSPAYINKRFKFLLRRFGMYKPGLTTHQLRHACATHLIEGGAQIRYVQELLGHESIETTVRYTKNQVEHLKRAYRSHHPRENQLYEEVGPSYLERLANLEKRIRSVREIRLSKLKHRGYDDNQ